MRYLLFPILGVLAACSPQVQPRLKSNEVLLQVSATGRTEVRPDEARITVGVSTTAPTAAAATTGNTQAMTRVASALQQAGVGPDDMQTRHLTLHRIDYGAQKGQYRSENLVEVRVRDISKAGMAISAATDVGGNVVSGPDLRVSNPDQADSAAYAAAYKTARARAETYAKAAGLKVARVLAIRDGAVSAPPIHYGDAYGVELQAAAPVRPTANPPVSAGVDVREVRIQADFALAK